MQISGMLTCGRVAVRLGRSIAALTLWGTLVAASGVHAQDVKPTDVIDTQAGKVQGVVAGGVGEFLGIPYAAPPVGERRWRPPQAPAPWTQTLQATRFADWCAQPQRGTFAAPSNSEDCLYLNVFTPDTGAAAARRPVMVWFYGGDLFSGESNDYDGSKLAARGGVVVVTLNYRVGAFGFFSHPALNAEGHPHTNYGIMDMQFALQWVQRNIAAFGGDPANVTIFGQSGGATAVMANLQSPLSKGLFHRAINQSGTRIAVTPPAAMLKLGEAFGTAAGCTDQSAACLRSLTVAQVLAKQGDIVKAVSDFPSVDGTVITETAFAAFSKGRYNRVPILTGLVQDEQAFFMPELNTRAALKAEDYDRYAASFGDRHKATLLKKYPLSSYDSPSLAEIAMAQGSKACTARSLDRAWAKYAHVYAYEFRDRTAPSYFPPPSYPMRAYHTAELQYLFPSFHGGQGTAQQLTGEQDNLSDAMVDYWTAFARSGNPNRSGGGADAPPAWAAYSLKRDNIQVLGLPAPKPARGYGLEHDCTLWDPILQWK